MQQITFEIDAQRVGRASGYIGGLTVERYTFTGATIPTGTRLAILTRAGVTIAAAEVAEGNAAEVDTNTQEVADLLRYQPLGACESVYIALGDADNILAIIPATMRKNWLDDEATHPPAPVNRYPTKTELEAWLERFDTTAVQTESAATSAQTAAATAAARATAAQTAQTAAESAATAAQTAQGKAEAAQAAAETAQKGAESAKDAAQVAQYAAEESAQQTAENVTALLQSKVDAAEAAQRAAETAAQNTADDVATLLQGKVDAAEAAKAGAEAAQTAAETAKAGAEAAKAAAASSATAAANSASAAAKSATDLAEAVATAESLDGRIGALEAGTGAYIIKSRDVIQGGKPTSADVGKVIYFDHFANETTSTLAVTNRTPWAQKVCPAPIVANGAGVCAVGCFDYVQNKKYIVFMTAISINPIGYLYELNVGSNSSTLAFKSKLATSYFSDETVGASYWCRNICVHDGHIFYTRRHSLGGPHLTVCDVDTGKLITNIDLDPKDTGDIYVNSAIWYNPRSGHICVLCYAFSLPTGETWGSNNASSHFIRVFSWDGETKTLSDIPNGDSPVTIIDVTDAFAEGGVVYVGNTNAYGPTWAIRDQVFVSIRGASYMALFHATADDKIEPCYEWDVEYETGEDGITRPVWETRPEEWTDADGNTQTIQNYVRNYYYDRSLIPKMTKGRLLKFCAATDYEGPPSGTWAANPMFHNAAYCYDSSRENVLGKNMSIYQDAPSHIILTNGVEKWKMFDGAKFVNLSAFNNLNHLKDPGYYNGVEYAPARDETTGVYLLNDVRKGDMRKYTGWLPKRDQYITNVGSKDGYDTGTNINILTTLTAAQSGTPLSRIGMVSNACTDRAAMTPLPTTATYDSKWWIASMLPYCPWGFFGNVWMTTYSKTIGGVL